MSKSRPSIEKYAKVRHVQLKDGYRYTNLPQKFFDDRRAGRITPMMFEILTWVWNQAGYYTGRVDRASASMILEDLWPQKKGRPSLSTVQRAVLQCAKCGYIRVPTEYRSDENYPIFALGYVVGCDEASIALRPHPIVSYRDALKGHAAPCAVGSADDVTNLCGTSAEHVTRKCATCDDSLLSISDEPAESGGVGKSSKQEEKKTTTSSPLGTNSTKTETLTRGTEIGEKPKVPAPASVREPPAPVGVNAVPVPESGLPASFIPSGPAPGAGSPPLPPEASPPQPCPSSRWDGRTESWNEDVEDGGGVVIAEDIRWALSYFLNPRCKDGWYRDRINARLVRNDARRMVESVPCDWPRPNQPSQPKPTQQPEPPKPPEGARQGSDGTWYAPDEDQDIEGDGGWWWYRLNAQMEHSPTDGLSPAEASALGLGDPEQAWNGALEGRTAKQAILMRSDGPKR